MMRSQKHLRTCTHCTIRTTWERRLGGEPGWTPCCIKCGVETPAEETPLLALSASLSREEFREVCDTAGPIAAAALVGMNAVCRAMGSPEAQLADANQHAMQVELKW